MEKAGTYKIQNKDTGKIYVGSTVNLQKREKDHFSYLRRGTHHNIYLQRAFDKYGEESFNFIVLDHCDPDPETLIKLEQQEYNSYKEEILYNIAYPAVNPMIGRDFSDEHREKISKSLKDYHKENDNRFKGKKHSKKSRLKMSKSQKKYLETNQNNFLGKKHTQKSKDKMSKSISKYRNIQKIDPKSGEVLDTYFNSREALKNSNNPNGCSGNIIAVCRGERKTSYGYI